MSASKQLRLSDLRAVYRVVGECRELGDDTVQWRHHLISELGRLTGAGFGVSAEIAIRDQDPRHSLGIIDSGAESGFNRAAWLDMLQNFAHDPFYNPLMNAYIARLPREAGACLARSDMIPDRDWYACDYYQTLHRTLGTDASLVCFGLVPGTRNEYNELFLGRAQGERDFTGRERALVQETMRELSPLVGGPLARFLDPSPAKLAPRVRQVLRGLLEGEADKQIATRLKISHYTVNEYVKGIYHHFGVATRAELLARWIKRGWGGRFAWAENSRESL